MERNETDRDALSFSEAMDLAFGVRRERVLRIVNLSTLCLFILSLCMLFMSYGDSLVFNLVLGFCAVILAFAGAFNWTMALMEKGKEGEEPQEADERGAVEDKKEK